MPVLNGNLWQKMTEDSKIAFIWGMWQTIAVENYLMQKYPDLKSESPGVRSTRITKRRDPMKSLLIIFSLIIFLFSLFGCANMTPTQQTTLSGAAIGAGGGALFSTSVGEIRSEERLLGPGSGP
jgi:hypothetical protein